MPHTRPRLLRILRVRARRLGRRWLARLDRIAPALLAWLPSWGTSLLIHAAGILLLALYFYARGFDVPDETIQGTFATQLTDDLTSLVASDHAGDPFTTLQSPDAPSLSLEPAPPDLETIRQPSIPTLAHFAPDLAGPELPLEPVPTPARGRGAAAATRFWLHAEDVTAPFTGRQGATRAQLVRREGGTVQSEQAVEAGLDWLVRHQRLDGGWGFNFQGQCVAPGCPEQACVESDTAATGLALLPLLGAGHIHTVKSRSQGHVRKGLDWLVAHQQSTGDLYVGEGGMPYMYSHAIATMALCEAYGLSGDATLHQPAQRAIDFIVDAQNTVTGGWRYLPGQPGDTSVFGWQMFALRSARLAGLRVPRNVLQGCKHYLDLAAADDRKVTYAYQPGRPATPVMTAEALLSRQYLGWPRDLPSLVKGAAHIATDLEQSQERNIYYWYYATQLLHNMQNKAWQRWNVRVRDGLVGMQVKGDGCDRGSWDPFHPQPDTWGARSAGRLYVTSLSLLTLEVYYRYLPLYQPSDSDPVADPKPAEERTIVRRKPKPGPPAPRTTSAQP